MARAATKREDEKPSLLVASTGILRSGGVIADEGTVGKPARRVRPTDAHGARRYEEGGREAKSSGGEHRQSS